MRTKRYLQAREDPYRLEIKERNDCVVRAISIAGNMPYVDAHEVCIRGGRSHGKGVHTQDVLKVLETFGYKVEKIKNLVQPNGSKYTPKTIGKKLKSGRYICIVNGHAFAVTGGTVHDWTNGRKHRILSAFKIVKPRG